MLDHLTRDQLCRIVEVYQRGICDMARESL